MELDTCLDSNMRTLSLFSLDVVINHNRFCVEFLLSLVSPVSANVIGKLCLFMLSYHTSAKSSWKHDDLYLGWKKTPLPLPIRHLVMVYTPWYWVKCILSMPVDPLLSFFFFFYARLFQILRKIQQTLVKTTCQNYHVRQPESSWSIAFASNGGYWKATWKSWTTKVRFCVSVVTVCSLLLLFFIYLCITLFPAAQVRVASPDRKGSIAREVHEREMERLKNEIQECRETIKSQQHLLQVFI